MIFLLRALSKLNPFLVFFMWEHIFCNPARSENLNLKKYVGLFVYSSESNYATMRARGLRGKITKRTLKCCNPVMGNLKDPDCLHDSFQT